MNKGIVALLVVLALLVLVSPGIVGMLAEKSVDEQIEWAELDNQNLVITAERFDRGWFSSQGRHRIELRESSSTDGIKLMLAPFFGHTLPALIVDTKLSHGPIAMTAAGESGSLSPGLGKAVSTLSFEAEDGQIFDVPGTVYSSIALSGDFTSNFVAEAGEGEIGTWGDVDISLESQASGGAYVYNGHVESIQIGNSDSDGGIDMSNFAFSGNVALSKFDFPVGDASLTLDYVTFDKDGAAPFFVGPVAFETSSTIVDGKVGSRSKIDVSISDLPGLGQLGLSTRFALSKVDAVELNHFVASVRSAQSNNSSYDIMSAIEDDLLNLLSAGGDLHIERLDIAMPQGTIKSEMNFKLKENDKSDPAWASMLLALEANAKFEIPAALADMAMMLSPQAGMVESFLIRNGAIYELEAAYKKGLLTVNGVPMALPIQ